MNAYIPSVFFTSKENEEKFRNLLDKIVSFDLKSKDNNVEEILNEIKNLGEDKAYESLIAQMN